MIFESCAVVVVTADGCQTVHDSPAAAAAAFMNLCMHVSTAVRSCDRHPHDSIFCAATLLPCVTIRSPLLLCVDHRPPHPVDLVTQGVWHVWHAVCQLGPLGFPVRDQHGEWTAAAAAAASTVGHKKAAALHCTAKCRDGTAADVPWD
jgi:hypothetical protein